MKAMSEKNPDLSEKRKRTAAEIMASSRQQYVISWILTALVRLAAALAVLGYGSQEISTALKGIDMDALPLEEIIRQALKKMVK